MRLQYILDCCFIFYQFFSNTNCYIFCNPTCMHYNIHTPQSMQFTIKMIIIIQCTVFPNFSLNSRISIQVSRSAIYFRFASLCARHAAIAAWKHILTFFRRSLSLKLQQFAIRNPREWSKCSFGINFVDKKFLFYFHFLAISFFDLVLESYLAGEIASKKLWV